MSFRRVGEELSSSGTSDPSLKGKMVVVEGSSPGVDQLSQGVAGVSTDAAEDNGWEVISRKSKKKAGNSDAKQWVPQNTTPKAWGGSDTFGELGLRSNAESGKGPGKNWRTLPTDRPVGRGNVKPQSWVRGYGDNSPASAPAIGPPIRNGWGWSTRATSAQPSDSLSRTNNMASINSENVEDDEVDDDNDDSDVLDDTDDDELLSDGFDSDASEKSHDTCKKDRWFKDLFDCLDSLTVEQINEPERQWHCPACKGGPGAIEWYNLQPLISHAKTKGSKRVKLHRKLAEVLEQELRRRGASVIPAGEVSGMYKGLDTSLEKEIVWPPMVIIMNTRHDRDDNDKWLGMGNQDLLDHFGSYDPIKARSSYGPQGHRGMSVLIFEASAVGYSGAERLSKHFEDTGRDRTAWERCRVAFFPGGQRQLFGYMAEKRDVEYYNQHSTGKSRLKFEMRSYQEMVVKQLKQMSEDSQQLTYFKNKVVKEMTHSKALEEAYGIVSEKYRKTMEENKIVRERTKKHVEQIKEEMDSLEQFWKEELKKIYDTRKANEDNFKKTQQEERETVKQSCGDPASVEDHRQRAEEIVKFLQCQDQEMEEFAAEREKLIDLHVGRMLELKQRHWEEQVALEKAFDDDLAKLMKKYSPGRSD